MKQSKLLPFLWVGQGTRLPASLQLFVADDFGNCVLVPYSALDAFGVAVH